MSEIDELNLVQAKLLRWWILNLLHISGLSGANEGFLKVALRSRGHSVFQAEIRRHLDYLENLGLLKVADRDHTSWVAVITPQGTDIVEGAVKPPPGIVKG